jgi:hypothetical protein
VSEKASRDVVRQAYDYCCGYCGVHEEEVGSELEIDHFQPRAAGGGDEPENLVYCCSMCNRLKGDFWPAGALEQTQRRLLHPQRDPMPIHLQQEMDGRLKALTETGLFHIDRLRLNRPPLVALRRARQRTRQLQIALTSAQEERKRLQAKITLLEGELEKVLEQLARLLNR